MITLYARPLDTGVAPGLEILARNFASEWPSGELMGFLAPYVPAVGPFQGLYPFPTREEYDLHRTVADAAGPGRSRIILAAAPLTGAGLLPDRGMHRTSFGCM